jgi:hypothetical protein
MLDDTCNLEHIDSNPYENVWTLNITKTNNIEIKKNKIIWETNAARVVDRR